MSTQHWRPVIFKGQEIWGECDAEGSLLTRQGRVRIAYQAGAHKAYNTFEDRLKVIDVTTREKFIIPISIDSNSRSGAKVGKVKGKANSSVFGGGSADVEEPAHIHLWSDGACTGNPGPAGAGTVLLVDERRTEWSTWLGDGTNNGAELAAVLLGLQALERPVERVLVVHTDSQYVIGVCAKGWKAKANKELVAELKRELAGLPRVVWHWVRGHEGVELNEVCDQLARDAIGRRDSQREEVGA